jgi:hypothetical protein
MESAISRTRSDDSTRLKTHIGHYVAPNQTDAAVSPPIHDGSNRRTHMGINHHPVLAHFLCPVGEIARFDGDSKTQGLFFGLTICAADYTSEWSNGCKKARSG